MWDILMEAYDKINDQTLQIICLEAEVADLKQRLSRKPKPVTTNQVQLVLEFDIPFLTNGYTLREEEIERRKKE